MQLFRLCAFHGVHKFKFTNVALSFLQSRFFSLTGFRTFMFCWNIPIFSLPLSTPLFLNSDSRLCVVELMLKVYMGFSEISLVIHGSSQLRRKYCVSDTCEMNLSILTMHHQTNGFSSKERKFNSSQGSGRNWGSGLFRCFTQCSITIVSHF